MTSRVTEGVAVVTLDRPEKRNSLDASMIAGIAAALDWAAGEVEARVVLLRGAGPDFCAGADLSALAAAAEKGDTLENLDDAMALAELFSRMRHHPLPIVAAVHGHAFAGGAGLALACDLVVCSEDASFAFPEVQLGFVPATVMALVQRAAGQKAAFALLATGDVIDAGNAARLGLVNHVYPASGFQEEAERFAHSLARRPRGTLRLIKRLFYGIESTAFDDAVARGAELNALARSTGEFRAGVDRFLNRRKRER